MYVKIPSANLLMCFVRMHDVVEVSSAVKSGIALKSYTARVLGGYNTELWRVWYTWNKQRNRLNKSLMDTQVTFDVME